MLYYQEAAHEETFEEASGIMVVEVILQLYARSTFVLKKKSCGVRCLSAENNGKYAYELGKAILLQQAHVAR
jgi:hypothetical protein